MVLYETNTSITSGIVALFQTVNDWSNGLLGVMLLFLIFIIGYGGSKASNPDNDKAFLIGFSTSSFFAALLWFLKLLSWESAVVPTLLLLMFILYKSTGD